MILGRVLQLLRRRPLLQTTFLRHHGALANHPNQSASHPAHHAPRSTRAVFDGTPHEDAVAYANLIDLHLRCGDLPRAEALFHAAPTAARGLRLDTAMLDGYFKAGRVDHARRLFDGMPVKSVGAWTRVVSGYCRARRVDEARRLFDAMPVRDVVSWTAMLQGYARIGMMREARGLFDAMPARDFVSWTVMLQGYARRGMLREAREVFDQMPERNVVTWTVMVKAYADQGHFQEAMELFNKMPQRNLHSWNIMISGFLRAGNVDEAVRLFERMPDRNAVSWTTMVTGLAQNGRVSMAREFFDGMPENRDTAAWNAMITAYANDGQMNEAQRLFDSIPAKDLVSWNAIIHGYAKNKHKGEVMGLFLLMLRSAVSPDRTTLISVLVTSESTVEVGQIHGLATTRGLLSDTSLGNALLTMYSRSGDLHSAWQVFKMIQEKDPITWTSMMRAFANHGRASYALQAFAQMLQHGYKPSSTTFIAALSACSHAGLVDKGRASRAHCPPSVQRGMLYEQWWGKLFQSLTAPLVQVREATTSFWSTCLGRVGCGRR
ncbi:pentatricopeptide repeat-containing protein At2g35030, mitochondrial-like [Hordeum vulgare subsp. vulgare]|uniref:Pentatricopeptide repeat-containing protein n=1 Tax=Hordeum vulgare subsp. vulgare TaxID=112509 RepID=A0A8I6Y005_HORVV|nr:pentatricopeptide repeat-containing protein At2g35030, mitochondrial-like [Hordeum vulgare subsp. vulgare]